MSKTKTELSLEEMQEFVNTTVQTITELLKPAIDAVMSWCKYIYDLVYEQYILDGAVYGETHEGFMRWLDVVAEKTNLEKEND
jgi:hypothetical protein